MSRLALLGIGVFAVLSASVVFAAGIGDTVKDVRSQYGNKVTIDDTYYVFSKPARVARMDVELKKFFGALPDISEFSKGIKVLLPADAKLMSTYEKRSPKKDIYVFKSVLLAKLPNIKDATLDSPPGTFTLYVNYDGDRIVNCAISMGVPGDADLTGAKKSTKSVFK